MNRIRSERAMLSLTQKKLAEKFGVDTRTIRNWEKGTVDISCKTLCRLADLFGCTVDYLLGRSETRNWGDKV